MSSGKKIHGNIRIRTELIPGDAGAIVRMHALIYHKEHGYKAAFEYYVMKGLLEFISRYNPEKDGIWIAEDGDKIVGSIFLMHRNERTAQLRYFLVDPEYRSCGLGTKLSEMFVDRLREVGYRHAYLWTTSDLDIATRMYSRMGFVLTESRRSTAFGKEVIEQRYDWAKI